MTVNYSMGFCAGLWYRSEIKFLSSVLTFIALAGFIYLIAITHDDPKDTFTGKVTWVTDGDTFKVSGHDWPIRIWGINAPERDNTGAKHLGIK